MSEPDSSIPENRVEFQARLLHLPDGVASGLIFIEQVAAGAATGCQNPRRPYLLSSNPNNKIAVIWRPDCKLWNCPNCGENKRRNVVARGYHGASQFHAQNRRIGFVTVTSHERLNAAGSMAVWPKAWHKLHHRLRRTVPDTEYLFVPELHEDGRMHAHGLVIDAPQRRWWKDNARATGFGFQDDMQEAESLGVVGYLAKYTTKTLQSSNFPKGTRRFRASQGWPKLPVFDANPEVVTATIDKNKPLARQIEPLVTAGYDVVFEYTNNFWEMLAGQGDK